MQRGELFVLSAPSGAGKTTVIRRLLAGPLCASGSLEFSVSHTTREPRPGEVDGRDYHFVDLQRFRELVAEDRFLEWARVHDHCYGTAREEVIPRLERGADVLLEIDVQGAEQIKRRQPEARTVFLMPPSYRDLEQRLRKRGLDDLREISRRLAVSLWEIRSYEAYDYVIINHDADRASEALAAIILQERHRTERMRERVEEVVEDFLRSAPSSEA